MYVKLFGSILKSSVWDESPATRLMWITMLLLADEDGFVQGVERGIARAANVSPEDGRKALDVLCAPDIESQNQDHGGRRLEKVEGGWLVLNYKAYRELRTREQVKAAGRQRRKRLQDRRALAPDDDDEKRDRRDMSRASASSSAFVVKAVKDNESVAWVQQPHWDAFEHYALRHADPEAFGDTVRATVAVHGVLATGAALCDMRAAGARFTARTLRGFAKKCADTAPRAAAARAPVPPPPPFCEHCEGERVANGNGRLTGELRHTAECPKLALDTVGP